MKGQRKGQLAISNFKFQISNLKSNLFSNLKIGIPNLKSQISNFKFQISNLKSQISNLKSEISNLKFQTRILSLFILLTSYFLLLLLPSSLAFADNRALSEQAEAAYRRNDYPEAVKLYEQLAASVQANPDVLYNLGTVYARAGQRGLAIWRYLQAQRLDPRDRELRANLELLAPGIFQKMALTPIPPLNWLYQNFTAGEWALLAGGTLVVAMLLLTLYFLGLRRSRLGGPLRAVAIALLILAAAAYPIAITHYYFDDAAWRGVVVAENTVARAGPDTGQTQTDDLPVGTVLRIVERKQNGWLKFSYMGGRMGFVEQDRVKSLAD